MASRSSLAWVLPMRWHGGSIQAMSRCWVVSASCLRRSGRATRKVFVVHCRTHVVAARQSGGLAVEWVRNVWERAACLKLRTSSAHCAVMRNGAHQSPCDKAHNGSFESVGYMRVILRMVWPLTAACRIASMRHGQCPSCRDQPLRMIFVQDRSSRTTRS